MERSRSLDGEYEKLVKRMDNPRVVIDNEACSSATVIKVDSARKSGVLLEAVQALTDLNLCIKKAYVSSDGRWFMDVFHVTDQFGEKLVDESVRTSIEQSLTTESDGNLHDSLPATALELCGSDRPGILSEVFAVLADLRCHVANARVWTHNGRVASLMHVEDEDTGSNLQDISKIHRIEKRLCNVLKGDEDDDCARARVSSPSSSAVAFSEHRLHQIMSADVDAISSSPSSSSTSVLVHNWIDRGYSIVNIQCRDRPKLLFDILCTLTDMDYVVFHATIDTIGDQAQQEFYIRQSDGNPISSEANKQRLIHSLQSGVERRSHLGARIELICTGGQERGILPQVTRSIRENGLSITGAEVSKSCNVFYVTDVTGKPARTEAIEAVRQKIGIGRLVVKDSYSLSSAYGRSSNSSFLGSGEDAGGAAGLFYLGSIVKRNLYNLGLIRSCS